MTTASTIRHEKEPAKGHALLYIRSLMYIGPRFDVCFDVLMSVLFRRRACQASDISRHVKFHVLAVFPTVSMPAVETVHWTRPRRAQVQHNTTGKMS
jgi:hypothetical protein